MKRLVWESNTADFKIVLAGDTHLGSVSMHKSGVQKLINFVKGTENTYWIHMGDWIEAISTDDVRFTSEMSEQPIPMRQAVAAVELFRPIADMCIVGLLGNHELKLHRFGNLVQDVICNGLGIPYGTYATRLIVNNNGKNLFKMFLWHGPSKGSLRSAAKDYEQRQANIKASLKEKMKFKMSDCAIMACGHLHKLLVVPPSNQLYITDGPKGVKQGYLSGQQNGDYIDTDRRWYVCTGSFTKLYTDNVQSYAEVAGYDPVELGFVVVHVVGGKIVNIEPVVV